MHYRHSQNGGFMMDLGLRFGQAISTSMPHGASQYLTGRSKPAISMHLLLYLKWVQWSHLTKVAESQSWKVLWPSNRTSQMLVERWHGCQEATRGSRHWYGVLGFWGSLLLSSVIACSYCHSSWRTPGVLCWAKPLVCALLHGVSRFQSSELSALASWGLHSLGCVRSQAISHLWTWLPMRPKESDGLSSRCTHHWIFDASLRSDWLPSDAPTETMWQACSSTLVRISSSSCLGNVRAGFWQSGLIADFHAWAAGSCLRILPPDLFCFASWEVPLRPNSLQFVLLFVDRIFCFAITVTVAAFLLGGCHFLHYCFSPQVLVETESCVPLLHDYYRYLCLYFRVFHLNCPYHYGYCKIFQELNMKWLRRCGLDW